MEFIDKITEQDFHKLVFKSPVLVNVSSIYKNYFTGKTYQIKQGFDTWIVGSFFYDPCHIWIDSTESIISKYNNLLHEIGHALDYIDGNYSFGNSPPFYIEYVAIKYTLLTNLKNKCYPALKVAMEQITGYWLKKEEGNKYRHASELIISKKLWGQCRNFIKKVDRYKKRQRIKKKLSKIFLFNLWKKLIPDNQKNVAIEYEQ